MDQEAPLLRRRGRRAAAWVALVAASSSAGAARADPPLPPTPALPAPTAPTAPASTLKTFDESLAFEPRDPDYRVAFSMEDADLPQLVRMISQLTGKRFLFGGKVRDIKATVYSPQKVTVAEAYQAFLAILETNGLTVVPHGRFLKIVETAGVATEGSPIDEPGQAAPNEERYVTRIQRLRHVSAEEVAGVLGHFKSKDGDITTYGPGNLLILTDTGANIRRMMDIVLDVDVGGASEKIRIEPIHYARAGDVAGRLEEVFDTKGSSEGGAAHKRGGGARLSRVFSDDRTNSLVLVGTEDAYLRALELVKRLDLPLSGDTEIHVIRLEHADATELTKTVTDILVGAAGGTTGASGPGGAAGSPKATTGIFEGRIKASADKATNSIVVTSSARDFAALHDVVARLDLPRRQVFIEAVIMDLTVDNSTQWASNFHMGGLIPGGANGDGLVYGGLNPLTTIGLPDPTTLQGMALGIRGPGIPGSETLLGTGITIPAFGVLMSALASSEDTDVLTTPHLLATDNVPAEINVGQNIPLQTNVGGGIAFPSAAGASGTTTPSLPAFGGFGAGAAAPRQDVGTKIKVTPHLNDSNEVRLDLSEEISEASAAPVGALGAVPLVKRTAQTTLTVRDQQTVVIGGLMRNRVSHSEDKIPVLGDIPLLGALFRSSSHDMQKANLVLVLTPYIIRGQDDLRTIFERKMQDRQEFLDRFFAFSEDQRYAPPRDYSRTNGLLEDIRQTYLRIEEERELEALRAPKPAQGHEPSAPLPTPTPSRTPPAPP